MTAVLSVTCGILGFLCGYIYRWRGTPFVKTWRPPFVGRVQRFSVGIYTGSSLEDLSDAACVMNPVLSSSDVNDVRAAFVADPFLFRRQDKWYMFMEVFNRILRRGEIGLATSNDGSAWSYQSIVLREPFHLSYPFLLEDRGEIWMIPESGDANSVRLYRAIDFPTRWKFEKNLLEGSAFRDASVFRHSDSWWMFVSRNNTEDLLLYYADELTGPWRPHPKSPIVYARPDIARCAGRPISVNGTILRFVQDCGREYGRAVRVFRVGRLDREDFSETELAPSPLFCGTGTGWNADGMHHVDLHTLPDGRLLAAVDGWRSERAYGLRY